MIGIKENERVTVVVKVIEEMTKNNGWCDVDRLQKVMFCLQEIEGIPLEFAFAPYKEGNIISYELRNLVQTMSCGKNPLMKIKPNDSIIFSGERYKLLMNCFPKVIKRCSPKINLILEKTKNKDSEQLGKIIKALYIAKNYSMSLDQIIESVQDAKLFMAKKGE